MSSQMEMVTGASLLVEREALVAAGGLDEQFAVLYGDVDLCLRFRKAGRRVVLCATTELVHHESRTRGTDVGVSARAMVASEEAARMRARHGWALAADPWLGAWLMVPEGGRLRLRVGAGELDPGLRCVRIGPVDFGQESELVVLRPGEPRSLRLVLPRDLPPGELHGLVLRGWGASSGAVLEGTIETTRGSMRLAPGWAPPGWLGAWLDAGSVVLRGDAELVVHFETREARCLVRALVGSAGTVSLEGAPGLSPLVELWVKPRGAR